MEPYCRVGRYVLMCRKGPVVRKPINTNPRLKINPGLFFKANDKEKSQVETKGQNALKKAR